MDSPALVDEKLEGGRKLVKQLDEAGHPPSVALWFLYPDVEQWRLLLGSAEFDKLDPTHAYRTVAESLAAVADPAVEISDVKIVRTSEPLIQTLRIMVRTGPAPSISLIHMTNNYINGIFIQDARAYRLS